MNKTELLGAIRSEIKQLKAEVMKDECPLAVHEVTGYLFALADILTFLDTIEPEPLPSALID